MMDAREIDGLLNVLIKEKIQQRHLSDAGEYFVRPTGS